MAHVLVRSRAALGLTALAAALVLAPAAMAAPAPYADWTFKVRRANEAGDLEALAAAARERPLFARIWFYGQVFDLVTPGVADAVKEALRPRLEVIADVLANGEPPDVRPRLFLDRAAHGDLEQHARAARTLQDDLIDAVRQNNPTPAWLAPAVSVEVAEAVVYGLMLRAEIASKRLGGDREKAHLVAVARRMAEGFALAQGDLKPWMALATYLGLPEDGMTSDADNVIELKLADALNARARGDLAKARTAMQVALDTTRAARGGSALTALLMNGTAHTDAWLNDRAGERRKRLAVLQAVRPLGEPTLVALVAGQMVQAHLADQSVPDLVPYLREMRGLGEPVTGVGLHLRTLKAAADALRQAGDARIEAGDFDAAERLIGEADATYLLLADPTAVRVTTPKAKVERELQDRVRARAGLLRDRARIARRRADPVGARGLLEKALAVYVDTLKDAGGAGATETALAQLAIDVGDPALALTHTQRARDHLNQGGTEADRARNYLVQGRARLFRGDLPQAFANANQGLETLKAAGD
ncbi:MAG: hypothetical protein KC583_05070, partial [Myxococcales bacterium]|nr:hypothetical protein [Myxococcales bacterium]